MNDASWSGEEFGRAFRRFLDWVPHTAAEGEGLDKRLRDHFGGDPSQHPAATLRVAEHDRPNLQVALDAFLARPERSAELLGVAGTSSHMEATLPLLAGPRSTSMFWPGPVARRLIALKEGSSVSCVVSGLFLVTEGEERLAVLVAEQRFPIQSPMVEVMASEPERAEGVLQELRELMRERNVYRGEVVSLASVQAMAGSSIAVTFHHRRRVTREQIVLPPEVLERVEGTTIEFDRHADRLRAAKQHLRRGLLLYGPPGTGKTLTATYLADTLQNRTVLVLTGPALQLVRATCTMARDLQPSMVVLEDVDLIAEERSHMGRGAIALLFELLNEIDGMESDADVIFLMTTNRAELLEPALAARPGRVDLAVEFPLPDVDARLQLLELYCRDLTIEPFSMAGIAERTDGTSPAYLRELVRKAALHAAAADDETVREAHVERALSELEQSGRLTRVLLGAGGDGASPATAAAPPPSARPRSC